MYGVEGKLLAIFLSLLMLLPAVGIRLVAGTFFIPAGIFSLVWFACSFVPLVLLFTTPINPLAIFYVLTAVFVFSLSATPFNWRVALRENHVKSVSDAKFDSGFLKTVLYVSVMASASLSVVTMIINGFTVEQVVFDLIATSGRYAAVRSIDGLEYGAIGIIGTMFTYLCPVLGGLRIFAPRREWFFVISIAPSLLTMVTQSSKLAFLVSLCFYVSGAIIAKIYSKQLRLPKVSGLPKLILGTAVLGFLVLISFVSRFGEFDPGSLGAITDPLLFSIYSYTMGQMYAFADFFSYTINYPSMNNFAEEYYSWGAYTFASIFDMVGIGKDFPPGMYNESVWYRDVFETNIFTFFRGIIYDFGIVGSLIFIFLFGVFSHAVTFHVLRKTRAWFALSIFLALLVFIFMGYLFSVFVARYVFLTAAITWLLFNLNGYLYPGQKPLNVKRNLGV
jgi:oligosaccharide repeat unit polymerase